MVAYTSSPGIEGYPGAAAAAPWGEGIGTHKVAFDFDWARLAAARAAAGLPALVAGDTIVVGRLPKGAVVLASASNVLVANGAAAAVSLGVAGTAGAFAAAVPTGSVAFVMQAVAPVAITVDTDIVLTLTGLPTTGKTRVTMVVANLA